MQPLEQPNQRATDLYWLAFLLTGHRGLSVDVTLQTLDLPEDDNPFFSAWMLGWSRRVFIAKALATIRGELAVSARQMASEYTEKAAFPPRNWTLARGTTKAQLESALLAIDVFPRCALLLSVFEGMSLEDVAILLDADTNLVRKGQIAGLRELTRKLARAQGWTSIATGPDLDTSEMQHV